MAESPPALKRSDDRTNGECLHVLAEHSAAVWDVALTDDARLVISGGLDGAVRLWDGQAGTWLRTLRPDRLYERMDITRLAGVTPAQRTALQALGAFEQPDPVGESAATLPTLSRR